MKDKFLIWLALFVIFLMSPEIGYGKEAGKIMARDINAPTGIACDTNGNLYVSEWGAGRIALIRDGKKTIILDGLSSPAGLVFDENGKLYIAGYGDGNIYVWSGAGKPEIFATGLSAPTGLLWDNGLIVANRNAGEVVKFDPQGVRKVISRGHKLPVGIARTADGNLFVSCYGGTVDVIGPNGKTSSISDGLSTPGVGIVSAGDNSVYVVDYAKGNIDLLGTDGVQKIVASGLLSPVALAKMGDGNLVVGCWGDGTLRIVKP